MKYQESKTARFFAGKGFYLVLAACLVAVGAAAWLAVAHFNPPQDVVDRGSDAADVSSQRVDLAGTPVSDVEDTRSDPSSAPETSAASADDPADEPAADVNTAPAAHFFVLPVTGEILKPFSDTELQYSETHKDLRLHDGVDIACDAGSVIKAAGAGVVNEVTQDANWGVTVVIDHGNGILGYYCGLNAKPPVKKGDAVTPGTQIGSLDEIPCECLDQSHLHLRFTRNGVPISPTELITPES